MHDFLDFAQNSWDMYSEKHSYRDGSFFIVHIFFVCYNDISLKNFLMQKVVCGYVGHTIHLFLGI